MKWNNLLKLMMVFIFFPCPMNSMAQGELKGSNMAEFQLGNIPDTNPTNQTSLYDQLNLSYRFKLITLKTRIEQYYPSGSDGNGYTRLSQYNMQYTGNKLGLSLGHLYTTLGQGILLRTYEIPGAVWETRGYRVRHGFYKDLHGAEVNYHTKKTELKVLRGRILDVTLPPTLDKDTERRPDLVEGGQFTYRIARHKAGIIYMRHSSSNIQTSYSSVFYNGTPGKNLSYYGELANRFESNGPVFSFTDSSGFAAYATINYTYKSMGISLEFKNYKNMSIGAGITDPPALVKEHHYKLLNRATHVPVLTNESGYQAEIFFRFDNNGMITLNNAISKNELARGKSPVYREYFVNYQFPANGKLSGMLFADYANDPLVNENNRYTTGFTVNVIHSKLSSDLEAEFQYTERTTTETNTFVNTCFIYTLSKSSKFSISAILEATNDPVHIPADKNQNYFPGMNLVYQVDNRNRVSAFAGKRRGGPACNSGVCYDVLDFEGIELRLSTRF